MDPSLYSTKNGGLSLHELLLYLEEDDEQEINPSNSASIYIQPPENTRAARDEDSDLSDQKEGNTNHSPRGILNQPCEIGYENNDSDSDDEAKLPLSFLREHLLIKQRPSTSQVPTSTSQNNSNKKRKKSHNWSMNAPDYDMNIHCEPKLPSNKAQMAETPVDFFKLFFDSDMLENIVDQTEIYGQHKNITFNFSKKELYVLLGDISLSGYAKYPNKRIFWNYGKHHAKQYIKRKPIRFGYKNWALCSNNGYMISFDIYTGKSSNEKQLGLGGDVVLSLMNSAEIPPNKGFKLYFDNYFTSITLLTQLAENNICATCIIRANRMEGYPFPDKGSWNKSERGTYKFLSNGELLLTQWKDNKLVTMASNFEDTSVRSAKRWCRETK